MKKLVTLLLAACMLLTLAACGQSGTTTAPAATTAATAAEATAAATTAAATEAATEAAKLSGTVTLAGSTSMQKLCEAMIESFEESYPDITVTAEYTGSGAGLESLVGGKTDIGNASRALKDGEKESGAKNEFLNHLTARATGKRVVALPIEATALGNLKIQMEADQ